LNSLNEQQINIIVSAIARQGYIIIPDYLVNNMLCSLSKRIKGFEEDDLKTAEIGRSKNQQSNPEIRRDKIHWLNKQNSIDNEYLSFMGSLRAHLNQALYLGLFDYESHYAIYQEGDFYKQHVDTLSGKSNRVLSTILYLNENWNTQDGGELVMYSQDEKTIIESVSPRAGTMVIFLSEQFPHEVLVANKTRYSIAGWFRVNASNSHAIDPSS